MSEKAAVINLNGSSADPEKMKSIALDSGRQVVVHSENNTEFIEVIEPKGEMIIKILLTDSGPVVRVHGAHLEIKSTETLTLESDTVKIKARKKAVVESEADLDVSASGGMSVHADDDVHITGRKIHLN